MFPWSLQRSVLCCQSHVNLNDQDNCGVENKRADVPISTEEQTPFTTNTMGS